MCACEAITLGDLSAEDWAGMQVQAIKVLRDVSACISWQKEVDGL